MLSYPRTLAQLAGFIRQPMSADACKALIRQRMATREERFLAMVARRIYGYPRSPYLPLLQLAGCEEGDLRAMVRRRGLEPALEALRDAGVYLSFEEFKGRTDVRRGGRTFRFPEKDFDNPSSGPAMAIRTAATRSAGSQVSMGFDYLADHSGPVRRLSLEALGVGAVPVIIWKFSRRSVGLLWWVGLTYAGLPPARWFFMVDPRLEPVSLGHRLLFRFGQAVGLTRGARLPYPEHAPLARADRVLDGVLKARDRHHACSVATTPSAAARLAARAHDRGTDLERVTFLVNAEPLTPGKAEEIRRSGARVGSMYSMSEAGSVGSPCGDPLAPDDMHFLADGFAMISHRRTVPGLGELDVFMLTSLLDSASKVMLNVGVDDFGEVTTRRCSCLFDPLGLHRHLAYVRSFTKLTGEGITVLGTDTVHILEEVLPREFGGRSIDYQLLEAEDDRHLTRLFLHVSPDVGPVDERRVLSRFVEELRKTPWRGPQSLWDQAETIRVVRRHPVPTRGGKLLPFHTQAMSGVR